MEASVCVDLFWPSVLSPMWCNESRIPLLEPNMHYWTLRPRHVKCPSTWRTLRVHTWIWVRQFKQLLAMLESEMGSLASWGRWISFSFKAFKTRPRLRYKLVILVRSLCEMSRSSTRTFVRPLFPPVVMVVRVLWGFILRHFTKQFVKLISTLKAFNLQSPENTRLCCRDNRAGLTAGSFNVTTSSILVYHKTHSASNHIAYH